MPPLGNLSEYQKMAGFHDSIQVNASALQLGDTYGIESLS